MRAGDRARVRHRARHAPRGDVQDSRSTRVLATDGQQLLSALQTLRETPPRMAQLLLGARAARLEILADTSLSTAQRGARLNEAQRRSEATLDELVGQRDDALKVLERELPQLAVRIGRVSQATLVAVHEVQTWTAADYLDDWEDDRIPLVHPGRSRSTEGNR